MFAVFVFVCNTGTTQLACGGGASVRAVSNVTRIFTKGFQFELSQTSEDMFSA